jgi:hypothetical protein
MSRNPEKMILEAFGLQDSHATRLELLIEARKPASVTVHMLPFIADASPADRFAEVVKQFYLVERPDPPKADSE